jgi:hypothetical protein
MRAAPARSADPYLDEVRRIALSILKDQPVRVFLFGSRAWGRPARGSDVDLGLLADQQVPRALLSRLREAFEESGVPYRVEVVDLREVDEAFRRKVVEDGVPWSA